MKRILILSAGYGDGHNTAANALAAALRENGHEAQVRDLFLEAYGKRQEFSRNLYLRCIERVPPDKRKIVTTHDASARLAPNSVRISGNATLTIDRSSVVT